VKRFLCGGAAGRNGHDTWIIADNKMVEEAGGGGRAEYDTTRKNASIFKTCAQK
jgi:hypothetical protein